MLFEGTLEFSGGTPLWLVKPVLNEVGCMPIRVEPRSKPVPVQGDGVFYFIKRLFK